MWNYERRLEYPVNIKRCNPQAAMIIMSQYGGLYSITRRKPFLLNRIKKEAIHSLLYIKYTRLIFFCKDSLLLLKQFPLLHLQLLSMKYTSCLQNHISPGTLLSHTRVLYVIPARAPRSESEVSCLI